METCWGLDTANTIAAATFAGSSARPPHRSQPFISVTTGPGITTVTRSPRSATSFRSARKKQLTPNFVAVYTLAFPAGWRAFIDETQTMCPVSASSIPGMAAWVV